MIIDYKNVIIDYDQPLYGHFGRYFTLLNHFLKLISLHKESVNKIRV